MTFPGRSLIGLVPCGGDCGDRECPAFFITCDCGTSCHLTVQVEGGGTAEAPYMCDGCTSVTWFTVNSP